MCASQASGDALAGDVAKLAEEVHGVEGEVARIDAATELLDMIAKQHKRAADTNEQETKAYRVRGRPRDRGRVVRSRRYRPGHLRTPAVHAVLAGGDQGKPGAHRQTPEAEASAGGAARAERSLVEDRVAAFFHCLMAACGAQGRLRAVANDLARVKDEFSRVCTAPPHHTAPHRF